MATKNETPKNRSTSTSVIVIVVILIACIILSFIVDYLNLFSALGCDASRFNWDFLSIIITNSIVIGLFLVAYFMIDRRNIAREGHKRVAALILLRNVYLICTEIAEIFDEDGPRYSAVGHCDGKALAFEDSAFSFYRNRPFLEHEQALAGFMSDGIFSKAEIERYYEIKRQYQKYINVAITLYDHYEIARPQRAILLEMIDTSLKPIEEELSQ